MSSGEAPPRPSEASPQQPPVPAAPPRPPEASPQQPPVPAVPDLSFLGRPLPRDAGETHQLLKTMTAALRQAKAARDAQFGAHMAQAGAETQATALTGEAMRAQQQQAVLNTIERDMLTTDLRVPQVRDDLGERLAQQVEGGARGESVGNLRGKLEQFGRLAQALDEDEAKLRRLLGRAQGQGLLERAARAFRQGVGAGATLDEPTPLAREVVGDMQRRFREVASSRFPALRKEWQQRGDLAAGGPWQAGGDLATAGPTGDAWRYFQGLVDEQDALPPETREAYLGELGRRFQAIARATLADEGLEPGLAENVLQGGGAILGLAAPLGAAEKIGSVIGRGATALGRRLLGRAALGGVAKTAAGRFAQTVIGQAPLLFAAGKAKGALQSQEDRIQKLPEDQREAAREAASIENGVRLAVMAPVYMAAGALGGRLGGGALTRAAGSATAFSLAPEITGPAEMGVKELLGQVSDDYRRKLELQIVANPDLRGALTKLVAAGAQGQWSEAAHAAEEFGQHWLGNAVGFGALHALHVFGAARDQGDEQLSKVATELWGKARKEIESGALSEDPAVQQQLLTEAGRLYEQIRQQEPQRHARALSEEVASATGRPAGEAVREAYSASRIQEGEALTIGERLAEVRDLRRTADREAEGNPELVPEAERLFAAERYLRAEQEGRSAEAQVYLRQYQEGGPRPMLEQVAAARAAPGLAEMRTQAGLAEEGMGLARRLAQPSKPVRTIADSALAEVAPTTRAPARPSPVTPRASAEPKLPVEYSRVAALPAPANEGARAARAAAVRALPPAARQQVEVALERNPKLTGTELATEAWYRGLHMAEDTVPRGTAREGLDRARAQLDDLVAGRSASDFASWSARLLEDRPLAEVARLDPAGREMLAEAQRFAHEHLLPAANEGTVRIHARAPGVDSLTHWLTNARDSRTMRRIRKWTEQAELSPADPAILQTGGGRLSSAIMRTVGSWAAWPIGRFGELGTDMTRTHAQIDGKIAELDRLFFSGVEQSTSPWLNSLLAKVSPRKGILEGFREAPRDAKYDPKQWDTHQLRQLLLLPVPRSELQDQPEFQAARPRVQRAALTVRKFLDDIRVPVARSSPYYFRMELRKGFVGRELRRLRARLPSMEAAIEDALAAERADPRISRAAEMMKRLQAEQRRMHKRGEDTTEIAQDIRDWKRDLQEFHEKRGSRTPTQLRSALNRARRQAKRYEERIAKIEKDQQDFEDAWGFQHGYFRDIPAIDEGWWQKQTGGESEIFAAHARLVQKVQSSIAKRKTGALGENADPDAIRALHDYIRHAVPLMYFNRFLQRHHEALFGVIERPTPKEFADGFSTKILGRRQYDEKIEFEGNLYEAIIGKMAREGKSVIALWRGDVGKKPPTAPPKERLADADWVKEQLAEHSPNLVLVPEGAARAYVTVERGGFFRAADPGQFRSAQEYLNAMTRTAKELRGLVDTRPYLASADRACRTVAYTVSTAKLGTLNVWSAYRAGVGAYLCNSLILGPAKAATGMRYVPIYWRRLAQHGFTGSPLRDIAFAALGAKGKAQVRPEDVELELVGDIDQLDVIRTQWGKRLRDGKDEMLDDAVEDLWNSNVLSGTRGFAFFDNGPRPTGPAKPDAYQLGGTGEIVRAKDMERPARTEDMERPARTEDVPIVKPGQEVTRPGTVSRAARHGVRSLWNKGWAAFEVSEQMVRISAFMQTYMTARRQGATREEARRDATDVVILAHGVFNPAMRSPMYRTGVGTMTGAVRSWASHFAGVLGRAPREQQVEALAAALVLGQIGAALNVDLAGMFGIYLHDLPGGEKLDYEATEAMPWLRENLPAGIPLPPVWVGMESPVTDAVGRTASAVGELLAGNTSKGLEHLGQAGARLLMPTTVEKLRAAFASEPDGSGEAYLYRPIGGTTQRKLWENGWSYLWRDFLGREPFLAAAEYRERTLSRQAFEAERAERENVGHDIMRLIEERGDAYGEYLNEVVRTAQRGSDPRQRLLRLADRDDDPRLREAVEAAVSREVEIDTGWMKRQTTRAAINNMGYRQLGTIVWAAPTKAARLRGLTRWLKSDRVRIAEADWEKIKLMLSPARRRKGDTDDMHWRRWLSSGVQRSVALDLLEAEADRFR